MHNFMIMKMKTITSVHIAAHAIAMVGVLTILHATIAIAPIAMVLVRTRDVHIVATKTAGADAKALRTVVLSVAAAIVGAIVKAMDADIAGAILVMAVAFIAVTAAVLIATVLVFRKVAPIAALTIVRGNATLHHQKAVVQMSVFAAINKNVFVISARNVERLFKMVLPQGVPTKVVIFVILNGVKVLTIELLKMYLKELQNSKWILLRKVANSLINIKTQTVHIFMLCEKKDKALMVQ